MQREKNRWLIVISSVAIHLCIGSIYAWSVFTLPLVEQSNWNITQVSFAFSVAILFLGLSAAFMGHFVEWKGPRISASIAALFFGLGIFFSGFAVKINSLPLLYLFYGVFGGIGLGIGYTAPVSSLVKWFPDKRGMATGLAIMGFGFGALISSPIEAHLIVKIGIANTFFTLGAIYFVVMISAAQYLARPPIDWQPKHLKQSTEENKTMPRMKKDIVQMTANEAVKTRCFWYLWLMLFINITCGIAVLAFASPMVQEIVGLSAAAAATMVGIMGIFNGGGRIIWASFSDYIGRPNVYSIFFILQIMIFWLVPHTANAILFQIMIFLIISCYGGGFAALPAYIGDIFGTKQLSAIHGYLLTAWATAGLVGPYIVGWTHDKTNSYTYTLYIFSGLFIIALIISFLIRADIKNLVKNAQTLGASQKLKNT